MEKYTVEILQGTKHNRFMCKKAFDFIVEVDDKERAKAIGYKKARELNAKEGVLSDKFYFYDLFKIK